MFRSLFGTAVAFVIVYIGLCVVLFFLQRSLIYFPQHVPSGPDASLSTVQVPGAELKVASRPLAGMNALLYFGGNAEDVAASLPLLSDAFPDYALYLPRYRGYGGSSGKPSEQALYADALALFDRVHAAHPNVLVIGRSLGSSVAIRVAVARPVVRLVLVTPFDSLQQLASRHYPWFPVQWLLLDKYESWRYAPRVSAPVLLLVAEHDEIIPRESAERLFSHFTEGVATFKVIAGTGHNSISQSPAYLRALESAR